MDFLKFLSIFTNFIAKIIDVKSSQTYFEFNFLTHKKEIVEKSNKLIEMSSHFKTIFNHLKKLSLCILYLFNQVVNQCLRIN